MEKAELRSTSSRGRLGKRVEKKDSGKNQEGRGSEGGSKLGKKIGREENKHWTAIE